MPAARNPIFWLPPRSIGSLEQMLGQRGQFVASLAQGLQPNHQSRQGEIELGPKLLILQGRLSGSSAVVARSLTARRATRPVAIEGREEASRSRR